MPGVPHILSMVEARDQLTRLPTQFEDDIKSHNFQPVVKVTKHNKPTLAILPVNPNIKLVESVQLSW